MSIKVANCHCSEIWFACDRKPVMNRAIQVLGRFQFIANW